MSAEEAKNYGIIDEVISQERIVRCNNGKI